MKSLFAVLGCLLLASASYAAEPNCWDTHLANASVWSNLDKPINSQCKRTDCACPAGKCSCDPTKSCPEQCPIAADYEWRRTSDGTQAGLFKKGTQVGAYRFADGVYRIYDGQKWGAFIEPPIAVPPLLLEHFQVTCGSSSSQQADLSSFPDSAVLQAGDDSGSYQSGSSGSSGRGAFMQRGPIRRLVARLFQR